MYKSIDLQKVVHLRACKKLVSNFFGLTDADDLFKKQCKDFVRNIPHKTNDYFQWSNYSINGFEIRYQELMNNFKFLENIALKSIEQNNLELQKLKKETEIKKIKKTRGGKREGSGRPKLGIKKSISISLENEVWKEIDHLILTGKFTSYADYFRTIIQLEKGLKNE